MLSLFLTCGILLLEESTVTGIHIKSAPLPLPLMSLAMGLAWRLAACKVSYSLSHFFFRDPTAGAAATVSPFQRWAEEEFLLHSVQM